MVNWKMVSKTLLTLALLSLLCGCLEFFRGEKPQTDGFDGSTCQLARCSYHHPDLEKCDADTCCELVYNMTGDYINCRIKADKSNR